jgi:osmoprotectant transport system permease protein
MLLLPFLGVGAAPAVVALTLLALAPIVINVDLALRSVDPAALDAAAGLGMNAFDRFVRVSVPLALPLAIAGIRTASVEVIASATLATFIGAGGLGDDIVRSMQTSDTTLLLASCALVAAMAFLAEFAFSQLVARLEVA